MVEGTAAGEADSTVAEEEDSTVEADFMEAAEEGFTAAEAFPAAGILVSAGDIRLAGIEAAVIGAAAFTEDTATGGAAGDTAGVEEVGVTEEVGVGAGAGDLVLGGRIGDMAGGIRMATTDTAWGITRPTLIILTRPTGLRTT
jgi:hypothetical protein